MQKLREWIRGVFGGRISNMLIANSVPRGKDKKTLEVANYFIYKFNTNPPKTGLTNKKLQKLLYYAQAWNLVLNSEKLFKDKIEAWIHGPAIPWIYGVYKDCGADNIKQSIIEKDFAGLTDKDMSIIDSVWGIYSKYDADYLELLTHSELPWQDARSKIKQYEPSDAEVSPRVMRNFYTQKLETVSKERK